MKSIWPSLIFLTILIVGVGFYRGWFTISAGRETLSHEVDVNLTISPEKVKADAKAAKEETHDLFHTN